MINTANLKDIGELNVYEMVWELKGVGQKKCRYMCFIILPFMALQGYVLLRLPVSARCILNNGMGDHYIKQMAHFNAYLWKNGPSALTITRLLFPDKLTALHLLII